MDFREILANDIAHYEHQQKTSKQLVRDECVKTDVNPRRSKLIGEMMMQYFPELECFRPQLNQDANEREFEPLKEFLDTISKYKTVQSAWKKLLKAKQDEHNGGNPNGDL